MFKVSKNVAAGEISERGVVKKQFSPVFPRTRGARPVYGIWGHDRNTLLREKNEKVFLKKKSLILILILKNPRKITLKRCVPKKKNMLNIFKSFDRSTKSTFLI